MKIGITSSSDINDYASILALRLIQRSNKPICFILVQQSKLSVLSSYFKNHGLVNTIIRLLRGNPPGHSNIHLQNYAKNNNLATTNKLSEIAASYNIKILESDSINNQKVVDFVKDNDMDVLINAGGGIFKSGIINATQIGILNAHMGILPKFRGMNALEWSLFYGDKLGVTIHFISKGIDIGDILLFKEIDKHQDDTTIDMLRDKSVSLNVESLLEVLASIKQINPRKQLLGEGKQYYVMHPRMKKIAEKRINHLF